MARQIITQSLSAAAGRRLYSRGTQADDLGGALFLSVAPYADGIITGSHRPPR